MKKVFLLVILYSIQNSILLGASIVAEFNLIANLGASKTFTKTDVKHLDDYYMQGYSVYFDTIDGNIELDYSMVIQLGFRSKISDTVGISSLIEFGYSPYSINTKYKSKAAFNLYEYENTDKMLFHSLSLGIIEKISFNKFSIGIGGGIVIPISGYGTSSNPEKLYYSEADYGKNYPLVMPAKNKYNYEDIKRMFKIPIAPYIKLTAEYEFSPFKSQNSEFGFILGFYINYNFGMKFNVLELNKYLPRHHSYINGLHVLDPLAADDIYYKYNFSNIDFGIVFGISIKSYKE